jgi:anti-anti-sigma factor
MEIKKLQGRDYVEMKVNGRLEGYWSDHLSATLAETVRGGIHRIRLDLFAVDYISSMGVAVLLRYYKELRAIGGDFRVFNPSESVRHILTLCGVAAMLVSERGSVLESPGEGASTTWNVGRPTPGIEHQREWAIFELFEQAPGARLECRTFGDPRLLRGCQFREADCRTLSIADPGFALGLGALGQRFADCRARLGEFLAVAGAAAYLPTDGTNVPDYFLLEGNAAPSVQACYGLVGTGPLGQLARFEARPGVRAVRLSEIVETALELTGANCVGMVLATESVGLIGAALRRSPALDAAEDAPFAHPAIRNWLTFTAERAFPHCVALIVGVAARQPCQQLVPFLRPLGHDATVLGHFHAAAFSYRSLPKGPIELATTVASLFETQRLQGLLHLLGDHREQTGLGESEFLRGACWFGPIEQVVADSTEEIP